VRLQLPLKPAEQPVAVAPAGSELGAIFDDDRVITV
jgi:hypothetical protein